MVGYRNRVIAFPWEDILFIGEQ